MSKVIFAKVNNIINLEYTRLHKLNKYMILTASFFLVLSLIPESVIAGVETGGIDIFEGKTIGL